MAEAPTPNKRCHNCRRQRLRCDRSYPHCNKCVLAGKECLGYGQLFRWTGAVASRGKLAGKTSSADVSTGPTPKQGRAGQDVRSRIPTLQKPEPGPEDADTYVDAQGEDWQLIPGSETADTLSTTPWVLTDPLVQDMSHSYRHYLSYFNERVCKDLVSFDLPEINPFRNLILLTMDNPLLRHIIVAASAAHMANTVCPPPPLVQPDSQIMSPSSTEASRRALKDALVAKHKALRMMHSAVQNIDPVGVDVVLAAALFLINVELIESGKHGWQAHLEGAGRIMSLLGPTEGFARDLRDYMLSDCFSYFVMASAFTPATSSVQRYFESAQIPTILQRATANSYLCCPPQVLEIIYAASQLSNVKIVDEDSAAQVAVSGTELLERAKSIDVYTWAAEALNIPHLQGITLESRINAGSAHRLGACLYIVQAVEPVGRLMGRGATVELARAMFEQLSKIAPEDPNFKATTWPTFIAGAGATEPERHIWVMDRLQGLAHCCPWGFLYTAMETLQTIWKLENAEGGERSWVQRLKDPRLNFLMV